MRIILYTLLLVSLADCTGCSKSGSHPQRRRAGRAQTTEQTLPAAETPSPATTADLPPTRLTQEGDGPTEVKMKKKNGVYTVPVLVNGVAMNFILDTGASLISMSETEASFLYKQGTITPEDIVGEVNFQDANGDISPGTVIRLRTVQLGDRTLENVQASVVRGGKAPLLLGQSALAQFGKVSLDYGRGVVTFD